MTRRALITGGEGFTGSRVTALLRAEGWQVTLLERAAPDARPSEVAAAVERSLDAADPDVVLSLAARRGSHHPLTRAADIIDSNVRLPALLLAGLAARGGGRIVTTSSYLAAPGGTPPTLFAAARSSVEPVLDWAAAHANVAATTLAPTSIYGPGDSRAKLLVALLAAARSGESIDLVAADRRIDLVHVDDVARVFALAATALIDGDLHSRSRYDVSSGNALTIAELVAAVEHETGRPIDARYGARAATPADSIDPPAQPQWLPSWRPQVEFAEGLRSVLARSPMIRP